MANDVFYLIDLLYEMIDGAKGVVLSPDKCIVIRDDEGYRDALEKLEAAGDADAYIRLVKQAYFSNAQLSAEDAFACYELYGIYRDALRRRKARK